MPNGPAPVAPDTGNRAVSLLVERDIPEVRLRITLIHNPTAGEGEPDADSLIEAIRAAGHSVHYRNSKDPALEQALRWPADLIVAAGGDGAVSRVLKQLPEDAPPLTILPLGTANNIAASLGIEGTRERLIAGWDGSPTRRMDIGMVYSADGERLVVEGIGIGAVAAAMRKLDDISGPRRSQISRARKGIRKAVARKKPRSLELDVDGGRGRFDVIFAEITNIRRIGPRIDMAPSADPGDGQAELIFLLPERRKEMAAWLEAEDWSAAPPLECLRGREITILRAHKRLRVDDDLDVPISSLPLTLDMGRRSATVLA